MWLCAQAFPTALSSTISQTQSHRTQHNRLILREKESSDKNRDGGAERVKPNLAEARGTGRELSDLYRLVVIGVILVIRIYVMITI